MYIHMCVCVYIYARKVMEEWISQLCHLGEELEEPSVCQCAVFYEISKGYISLPLQTILCPTTQGNGI